MTTDDIILGVSSPPGASIRGLIRGSGRGAFDLLAGALTERGNSPPLREGPGEGEARSRFTRHASFERLHLARFELPVILLTFPTPASYTGEDVFELLLPGNPVLLERVIDELIEIASRMNLPARRAEAGEFTARAYFNRKLSLTEAEGISALISAQSDAELRAAKLLASGTLGDLAHALADDLAEALALVEAGIDFTDQEDVVAIAPENLFARLRDLSARIAQHLDRAVGFEELEAIPWVVLMGEPNAGKSTLFNALLGRERAVVSEIAGTTRDVLAEPLEIETEHGPAEVMLVDLAGLDATDLSAINVEMQKHAHEAINRAELLLRCVPCDDEESIAPSAPLAPGSARGPNVTVRDHDTSDGDRQILVRTKADRQAHNPPRIGTNGAAETITVSALTGVGLDELRRVVAARLADRAISLAGDALALRPRHEAALRAALAHLTEAGALAESSAGQRHIHQPELVATCMRSALDELGALAGDITPDDVLGRIFASFCIGK